MLQYLGYDMQKSQTTTKTDIRTFCSERIVFNYGDAMKTCAHRFALHR